MSTPPRTGSPCPHEEDSTLQSNLPLALPPPPPPPPPQPSTNPRRLPPPCWSHDETIALIDAYRDKWYALRRGNLKANHWQEVADAVSRRCPAASPPKTAVQCRHKMEKLRKRYRNEIQRARSMPVSRFSSSWVHFKRMDAMEKGPQAKPDYNSDSDVDARVDHNDDDVDDDDDNKISKGMRMDMGIGFYHVNNNGNNNASNYYKNGNSNSAVNTRSLHKLYRNGIGIGNATNSVTGNASAGSSGCSAGSGGFRIRIPTGVSIAQPAPKFYAKIDHKYDGNSNLGGSGSNSTLKSNFGIGPTRVARGSEETGKKREREPIGEMVAAIKVLGEGFVRMEQMKMDMARELETMRMDMEMKRTEMILESQQRIVDAFAKAFSEKSKKKRKPNRASALSPQS